MRSAFLPGNYMFSGHMTGHHNSLLLLRSLCHGSFLYSCTNQEL